MLVINVINVINYLCISFRATVFLNYEVGRRILHWPKLNVEW